MSERLSDDEFVALLVVLIEADPWSFSANRQLIEDLLDSEARERGYCDWIEALHELPAGG